MTPQNKMLIPQKHFITLCRLYWGVSTFLIKSVLDQILFFVEKKTKQNKTTKKTKNKRKKEKKNKKEKNKQETNCSTILYFCLFNITMIMLHHLLEINFWKSDIADGFDYILSDFNSNSGKLWPLLKRVSRIDGFSSVALASLMQHFNICACWLLGVAWTDNSGWKCVNRLVTYVIK